ncbi:CapA family protein [Virgibacillus sp. DJP39]|uniref:CapA family protein n=1 Tax=Virgibacillus sp. DJP39 TaxID=3409790 RepID=UPI003BB53FFA
MSRCKASFLICFCVLLLTACTEGNLDGATNHSKIETTVDEKQLNQVLNIYKPHEVTLSAIGDLLIHQKIYQDAFNGTQYNFTPMLDEVAPYLKKSDITIANQETMIGGVELGLSTYPTFNSPQELGAGLKNAGVDVVTIANNHTLDGGETAIQNAISYWEKIDMMYTGAYKSEKDRNNIRVLQANQISIAFLAYTYGTNGIPVPSGKDYLVNLIDKQKMASDIKEAGKISDVIVLSLHFGNEYQRMPSQEQKELVQFIADQGVHVVIGHHPHVLQPVDYLRGRNGHKTFVAYSLGNFLSGQEELYRRIGGMVQFTIRKTNGNSEENIEIVSPKFMPTFVDDKHNASFDVIPMFKLSNAVLPNAQKHYNEMKVHMSQWLPELEFIEE